MYLTSDRHTWSIVKFDMAEFVHRWRHEPGVKDPVGLRAAFGYLILDVALDQAWSELEALVGTRTPLLLEGVFLSGTKSIILTALTAKDVEVVDGRAMTVTARFNWEAFSWPEGDERPDAAA